MAKPMTRVEWEAWVEKAWDTAVKTAQESKEWIGLTDEERAALLEQATYMDEEDCEHLLMLAEAKLKEKNAA